jgi:hypothetical protein
MPVPVSLTVMLDVVAGRQAARLVVLGERDVARGDDDAAAVRHGVARVHHQVQQGRLEARAVDHGAVRLAVEVDFELDAGAAGAPQHRIRSR